MREEHVVRFRTQYARSWFTLLQSTNQILESFGMQTTLLLYFAALPRLLFTGVPVPRVP